MLFMNSGVSRLIRRTVLRVKNDGFRYAEIRDSGLYILLSPTQNTGLPESMAISKDCFVSLSRKNSRFVFL